MYTPRRFTLNAHTPQVQTDFIIRLEKSLRISLSAQTGGLYYTTHFSTNVDGQANGADLEIRATLSEGFGNPSEPGRVCGLTSEPYSETWLGGAYSETWLGGVSLDEACPQ